jgi:hypothetical protein
MREKISALLIAFMILGLLLVANYAHCATTSTAKHNSLGTTISIDPNAYFVGSIVSGEMHQDKDGRVGTNVRVHPKTMYALFDESIMFCGDESIRLSSPEGSILNGDYAFTYRREASRLIEGIACHELRSVDKLAPKEVQ